MPEQVEKHAPCDITDIIHPFPQVFVVDIVEECDVSLCDLVEAEFYIKAGFSEFLLSLLNQGNILQHQQMCIENPGLILPKIFGDIRADLLDLPSGFHHGSVEAFKLGINRGGFNQILWNIKLTFQENEGGCLCYPRRSCNALQFDFLFG